MPVCLGVLCVPSSSIRVSASYVMLRAYFYRSSLTVAQSPSLITLQRSLPRSPHHLLALSLCLTLSLHNISSVLFFPFLKFIFVVCNTRSRSLSLSLSFSLSLRHQLLRQLSQPVAPVWRLCVSILPHQPLLGP